MNEVFDMDCERYRSDLVEAARARQRGSSADESLRAHLRDCAGCQLEFGIQKRLTEAMTRLSDEPGLEVPAPMPNAALLAAFDAAAARPQPHRRWVSVGAIAAALLLCVGAWQTWRLRQAPVVRTTPALTAGNVLMPPPGGPPPEPAVPEKKVIASAAPVRHRAVKPAPEKEQPFVAIPFTAQLGPDERADIVQMDLPVSALIAAGFPLHVSDPGARARADLVVGQDGRARAVRLISISNSDFNRSFQ